jgi:hypothetical protein
MFILFYIILCYFHSIENSVLHLWGRTAEGKGNVYLQDNKGE